MSTTKWSSDDGSYNRQVSSFRNLVSPDSAAPFAAERDRYRLYVSLACPWAHRTLIVRKLKGLEDIIPVTVVDWYLGDKGWRFADAAPDAAGDKEPLYGFEYLRDLYFKANPNFSARFTVPVLWDQKNKTIVNNESLEIIRMFNTAFDNLIDPKFKGITFYPESLKSQIDDLNSWIYDDINNGVYKTGFASVQKVYDANVHKLFESLDRVEKVLGASKGDYLLGDTLTEADIRLFTTIIRFDPVYVQHFKCNIRDIRHGYPNIHKWVRRLYWTNPAFKETTNFDHIKFHYTKSHLAYNPFGITPAGPIPNILPLDA